MRAHVTPHKRGPVAVCGARRDVRKVPRKGSKTANRKLAELSSASLDSQHHAHRISAKYALAGLAD
jgi:hypothetical protein